MIFARDACSKSPVKQVIAIAIITVLAEKSATKSNGPARQNFAAWSLI